MTTVSSYYIRNKCLESEVKVHIQNVVSIYTMISEAKIPVDVSFDTISISLIQSVYPFPRLIITPYAAFKAFFNSIEGQQTYVHKTFANLFKFFNQRIDEMTEKGFFSFLGKSFFKSKNPFDDIVNELNGDKNIGQMIKENDYLNRSKLEL